MEAQKVRYLYNDKGEPEFALVPVDSSGNLMLDGSESLVIYPKKPKEDLSKYFGIFQQKTTREEIDQDLAAIRDEWERDFDR